MHHFNVCNCFVVRVVTTPSASLNVFSSKEVEFEQKAALLKRLSFAIFCSEVDQYQRFMPDIQGAVLIHDSDTENFLSHQVLVDCLYLGA